MILAHTAYPALAFLGALVAVVLANLCALVWMLTVPRSNRRATLGRGLMGCVTIIGLSFLMAIGPWGGFWPYFILLGGAAAALVSATLGYVGRSPRKG